MVENKIENNIKIYKFNGLLVKVFADKESNYKFW